MKYKAPGIYVKTIADESRIPNISIDTKRVAGFVGIAERGPFNTGIRIRSFDEYVRHFGGFIDYGYLPYGVHGFFNNGGSECVVVRIAHLGDGDDPGSARQATLAVNDINDDDYILVQARAEGTPGNDLRVRIWYGSMGCLPFSDFSKEEAWISVDNPQDYEINDMVCIRAGTSFQYRRIIGMNENVLYLEQTGDNSVFDTKETLFLENVLVNISIIRLGTGRVEDYVKLSPNHLSENFFVDRVNRKSPSVEIRMQSIYTSLPQPQYYRRLEGGDNGILGLTPGDFIGYYGGLGENAGLGVLAGLDDIAYIAIPDIALFEELVHTDDRVKALRAIYIVQQAMIDQCELLPNRFALLDMPNLPDIQNVKIWRSNYDSMFASIYYPKILIKNPGRAIDASIIAVPPSAHVAGVFAYLAEKVGLNATTANNPVKDTDGINMDFFEEEFGELYEAGINYFRHFPGKGVRIWGARTLSSNPEWTYINIRQTFSAIKDAIEEGTQWAIFENYNEQLISNLISQINVFLHGLWSAGHLAGESAEEAFYVVFSEEFNPPERIRAGVVTIVIGIAMLKPAEFFITEVNVRTGSTAE